MFNIDQQFAQKFSEGVGAPPRIIMNITTKGSREMSDAGRGEITRIAADLGGPMVQKMRQNMNISDSNFASSMRIVRSNAFDMVIRLSRNFGQEVVRIELEVNPQGVEQLSEKFPDDFMLIEMLTGPQTDIADQRYLMWTPNVEFPSLTPDAIFGRNPFMDQFDAPFTVGSTTYLEFNPNASGPVGVGFYGLLAYLQRFEQSRGLGVYPFRVAVELGMSTLDFVGAFSTAQYDMRCSIYRRGRFETSLTGVEARGERLAQLTRRVTFRCPSPFQQFNGHAGAFVWDRYGLTYSVDSPRRPYYGPYPEDGSVTRLSPEP